MIIIITNNSEDPEFIEVKNQLGAVGLVPLNKLKVLNPSRARHLEELRHESPQEDEHNEADDEEEKKKKKEKPDLWARAKDNLKKKVKKNIVNVK